MIDVSTSTSGWGMHAGSDVVTFATSSGGCQGRAVRQRPSDRRAQEAGAGRHEGPRRGDRPGRGGRCRQEHPAGARTHHIARSACRTGGGHQRRTATSVRGPPARVRHAARPRAPTAAPAAGDRGGHDDPGGHGGYGGLSGPARPSHPDPLEIGLALLRLLSAAAAEQPLLCLHDDAHLLDQPSREALAIAARRCGDARAACLFTLPLPHSDDCPELASFPRMRLSGLMDRDALALLRARLSAPLDPSVCERIVAEAHGNPRALPSRTARALPDGDGIRTAPGAGAVRVAAAGLDARRGERPAGLGTPGAAGGRGGAGTASGTGRSGEPRDEAGRGRRPSLRGLFRRRRRESGAQVRRADRRSRGA